jgi:hypothetical protein
MENKIYFEIEGIKFRYDTEDDYLARYFKKAYKNYRVVSTERKNNKMYFYSKNKIYNFDSKTGDLYQHKKFILNIHSYDYCELDDLPIDYWKELDEYIDNELNPNPSNESFNDFMRGVFDTPDDCHYWSD